MKWIKTIHAKIILLFVALNLLISGFIGITFWTMSKQESDSVKINLAGRQRMFIQKMTKELNQQASNPRVTEKDEAIFQKTRNDLMETVRLFDKTLRGLINGDDEQGLPPASNSEFKIQLLKVKKIWSRFNEVANNGLRKGFVDEEIEFFNENNIELLEEMDKAVTIYTKLSKEKFVFLKKMLLLFLFMSIFSMSMVLYYSRKMITIPLETTSDFIVEITENKDFSKQLPIEFEGEIGKLTKWFNAFITELNTLISKVKEIILDVNSIASEISATMEEQTAVSTEQSTAVLEITSTMEELSTTSTEIAGNAQSVVEVFSQALQASERGVTAVEEISMKMEEINRDNQNNINEVVELGKKSKEISIIMEIINNIVDQTKLIAFNASIEASAAGETGKRFGVVATEIRRLADNVMESTVEIERKIDEIQQAINRLVIASEKGSIRVQKGRELSTQTVNVLKDMLSGAQSTAEAAKQISLATQQQKTANSQVVLSLKEISNGVNQSSDAIKQTSSAVQTLTKFSKDLKEIIEKFKLNDSSTLQ